MIRAMSSIMGIAVLGAVYSLIYQANIRGRFGIQFKSLPVGSDESLSQTLTALHDSPLPHTGVGKLVSIVTEAQGSFITAYDLANWVAVAALSVGLLLSIALVPARLPDHTDMPTSKDARTPSSTTRG
jgi:hypothetical protein